MDRCWTAGGFVRPWCTSLDAPLFLSLSLSLGASLSLSLRTTLASSVGALQEKPLPRAIISTGSSPHYHKTTGGGSQEERRRPGRWRRRSIATPPKASSMARLGSGIRSKILLVLKR